MKTLYKYPVSILNILKSGNVENIKQLFAVFDETPKEEVYSKCYLFIHFFFPQFFKKEESKAHWEVIKLNCDLEIDPEVKSIIIAGFRNFGKTTLSKLIQVFFLANNYRSDRGKYYKVISMDDDNSRQVVTDLYNLLLDPRLKAIYSHLWQKTNLKTVDTQEEFDLANGVKVKASTVNKTHRGKIQMESRPDRIWFEDIEDSSSIRSQVKTANISDILSEAYTSLALNGKALYNVNYISKRGNVHKLMQRALMSPNYHRYLIVPIMDKDGNPTWFHTREEIAQIERDTENFQGEYMCNPSGSIDAYFNEEFINLHPDRRPIAEYDGWCFYDVYKKDHVYVMGVDPAGGNGGDYAVIVVIDITSGELVAHYYNRFANEQKLGDIIAEYGQLFGNCIVGVERNNHGHAVLLQLKHRNYPNIFREENQTTYDDKQTEQLGFLTTNKSKPAILSALSSAINNFDILIPSDIIKTELKNFPREYIGIKKIDPELGHFDGVMATAIAYEMRKYTGGSSKTLIIS